MRCGDRRRQLVQRGFGQLLSTAQGPPVDMDAGAAELAKMVVGRNYRALPMQPRMGNALRRPKRPPAVDTTKINTVTATGSSYGDGREEPVWRTSRPHEFAKRPC